MSAAVIWHDVECGSYVEDLPFWRALADAETGPILDVGAGTGRVSTDLARAGHVVVALDIDAELLAACAQRSAGLPVRTACADARTFALGERFGLIVVPMQTVQLLGDAGRVDFLARAREHLTEGGLLACALADAMDAFDTEHCEPPVPDVARVEGILYSSQPVALRDQGDRVVIERIRTTLAPGGRREAEGDSISLDRLTAATLEAQAAAAGLHPLPAATIAATDEHVGSKVVLLRG